MWPSDVIPGDVVEDECRGAGVRVLKRSPHALTDCFVGDTRHNMSFFLLCLVVTLSLRVLSSPATSQPSPVITGTKRLYCSHSGRPRKEFSVINPQT